MAVSIFSPGGKGPSDYMILTLVKPASTYSAYFNLTVPEGKLAGIVGLADSGGSGGFYTFGSLSLSDDKKKLVYSDNQNGGDINAPQRTLKCLYLPVGSKYKNFEIKTVSIPASSTQSGTTATITLSADKGIIGGIFSIKDSSSTSGQYRSPKLVRKSDRQMTYSALRYSAVPTRNISYYVLY